MSFPGARRPDRQRWVSNHGLRLCVWEWGDADAPPLLLAHGGFDFAGTYDVFAPLLAAAGWRVAFIDFTECFSRREDPQVFVQQATLSK